MRVSAEAQGLAPNAAPAINPCKMRRRPYFLKDAEDRRRVEEDGLVGIVEGGDKIYPHNVCPRPLRIRFGMK
jgi:hypothetical protein